LRIKSGSEEVGEIVGEEIIEDKGPERKQVRPIPKAAEEEDED
jgi:hypothetical protein